MNILVVHPDPAAAQELVDELVDFGHDAQRVDPGRPGAADRDAAPDVLVVCLDPDPDLALGVAEALLSDADHQAVPVLFTGGEEGGLLRARERFPKASFTRRDALPTALASLSA